MPSTKEQLLSFFKEVQGQWISGELLGEKLQVSRNAVWKHIRKLKGEGYVIESSPRKGYLLRNYPDLLLPVAIREGLSTKIFGQEMIVHEGIMASTNTRARELAAGGAAEGTIVVAECQTGGRGRRGRSWFSPSGCGIYASMILRPIMSPVEAPRITLAISVALAEALREQTSLTAIIRWPNDIFINEKKVAGILTEITTELDGVDYIVAGFGININTPREILPADVRDKATSLFLETGRTFSRLLLLRSCLVWWERYYAMFARGDFASIMNRWKEFTDTIGRQVTVDAAGRRVAGRVVDVDQEGVLLVVDDAGTRHRIFSGDVTPAVLVPDNR